MASLIDVNVLVALLHARHCHSAKAVEWLERQRDRGSVLLCRVVQMGGLRVLTQPAVMKEEVLSASEFWEGWAQLMEDERFLFVEEPSGLEQSWREVTRLLLKGKCAETDAYLAALALSGNWTFTTFDRAFQRFSGIDTEILRN